MNSKSINEIQDEILEEFEPFDDWMDKYSLLIDMGNTLLPLEDSEKTPEHIIEGCQSRVWIVITPNEDGTLALRGDSDALIVKGIAALLLRVYDGQRPEDIVSQELYFIDRMGLRENLSPTRSNGLVAMIEQIHRSARTYLSR